jgi:hypothetical protein
METIKDLKTTDFINQVDELEAQMVGNYELVNCPLVHRFTDGLYVRQVSIPKGTLATSEIHLTQHQYFLLKGKVTVWSNNNEPITIEAPYIGTTEPNTRRVVYVWEDCVWATSHPNPNNENVEQIEDRIIQKHDNPNLDEGIKKIIKELIQ